MTDYAPYAWLITHDSIADPAEPLGTNCNAPGVVGPHNADPELVRTLHQAANIGKDKYSQYPGNTVKWFKLYDDDGNLYYTGVWTGEEGAGYGSGMFADEVDGMEPLDDFGTPNAGATEIRYYKPATGDWETL